MDFAQTSSQHLLQMLFGGVHEGDGGLVLTDDCFCVNINTYVEVY